MKKFLSKVILSSQFFLLFACNPDINPEHVQWQIYSGDNAGSRFSTLSQINRSNVQDLKPVWIYRTEDAGESTTIQCNPIIVNEKMFIISPGLKLTALNALTGNPIWTFDPAYVRVSGGNSRGVTYWTDGQAERIFYGASAFLFALNVQDGRLIPSFGQDGKVDLHEGLGDKALTKWVTATSPGIVYKNLLILGSRVGEGPAQAAPGYIRAFDVNTGDLKWLFRTIPAPGEYGSETWPVNVLEEIGGANTWGGFTLDVARGMVFCGTGSTSYDHYGGNREGANLFANCVLALDAATGERIWHYQVVHHDLWDYDIPCQPNLVQVKKDGKLIDAVAQPTKVGHLFVLDRETGDPIFPVEELAVPQSEIPGEKSWPTQPFPPASLRYTNQQFTEDDITDISTEANQYVKTLISEFRLGGVFLPPGKKPTIIIPQFNGGTNWGGAAYDPEKRFLYVNNSNEAEWTSMISASADTEISRFDLGAQFYKTICSDCHGNRSPRPGAPGLNNLNQIAAGHSHQYLHGVIQNGKGQMPAFAHLSDDERTAIIAFLKQEGKDVFLDFGDLQLSSPSDISWIGTGHRVIKDHEGFPINRPPWGNLTAIDLDQGKIAWQMTLGTYPELEKRGYPLTGTFNMGGPIVTAGGLVFVAATMDERIRAFDKDNGATLWEYQLETGGYATPSTFEIDGKQMIVIAAGGGGKPGTRSGDAYYCFGL